jgi:dihydrodipicolinate synthase/N-acetylneuraminate lyase
MPYYIYRVTTRGAIRTLATISQFEVFKEASNEAKRLRRETELQPDEQIKTIFADNELHAEELLSEIREDEPRTGEDY